MSGNGSDRAGWSDRRIVLWVVAAMFVIILGFTALGPKEDDKNPEPTTYNTSSKGARAAFLLLPELGYEARRWDSPMTDLRNADAAHATLILTEPKLPIKDVQVLRQAVAEFLRRGGWVVATGESGALLLPGGSTGKPANLIKGLCYTRPEGSGALARAGQVQIAEPVRWAATGPEYLVEQRCGQDAVVVRYHVGEGEAIWWSSPMPLTNAGLSEDPSLKLLLASVGPPGRKVLFDEYLHTYRESIGQTLSGLPWWPLAWQCVAIGALLLFSFSRRSGPLRMPVTLPRTSPIEFAESMGRLYARAGTTQAATDAARGRVTEYLRDQCGVPRETLAQQQPEVARLMQERFGGDWSELDQHLKQTSGTATNLAPKSALKLVRSLDDDYRRLQQLMRAQVPAVVVNK